MKSIFTMAFLALCTFQSQAQSITGANMETWKTYSGTLERPDGWHSSDSLIKVYYTLTTGTSGFAPRTSKSTAVKNSGSASAMLITPSKDTLPTILANSNIKFDLIAAMSGDYRYSFTGGTPVSKRIYYVHAYVQYAFTAPADEGEMSVLAIKNGIAPGGEDSVIGKGTTIITASSSFKKITTALTYTEATMIPDRLIVSFVPTNKTKPEAGTTLYVDDVMISDPSGIEVPLMNSASVKVYPNPVSDKLHIRLSSGKPSVFSLYSTAGQLLLSSEISDEANMDMSHLLPGTYLYVISSKADGKKYYSASFSKQ